MVGTKKSPLEIASPRMTLKAGTGFRPVVVFRPQLSGLESVREMIRLAGGSTSRLAIQGVELRLELPCRSLVWLVAAGDVHGTILGAGGLCADGAERR